jgi:hypothetical protein
MTRQTREETMSDSAEENAPGHGANGAVSAPAKTPIEPDAAEEFASAFVPVWQFDDAPFSAGGALSAEEMEELGSRESPASGATSADHEISEPSSFVAAGAFAEDAAAEVEPLPSSAYISPSPFPEPPPTALATDPLPLPKRSDPIPMEPSVVIAEDVIREAMMLSAPRVTVAEPIRGVDESEVFRAQSNKRLIAGVGAVVAILGILGFLLTRAAAPRDAAPPALSSPSTRTAEDIPLPPPPSPPPPDMTATATAASAAPPPAHAAPAQAPARETPSPLPPAPRPAATAPTTHAQEPVRPPRNSPKNSTKPAGGGIVRDNPF